MRLELVTTRSTRTDCALAVIRVWYRTWPFDCACVMIFPIDLPEKTKIRSSMCHSQEELAQRHILIGIAAASGQQTSSITTRNIAPCYRPRAALHCNRVSCRQLGECLQGGVDSRCYSTMHPKENKRERK